MAQRMPITSDPGVQIRPDVVAQTNAQRKAPAMSGDNATIRSSYVKVAGAVGASER
jgi:hypothetical protein